MRIHLPLHLLILLVVILGARSVGAQEEPKVTPVAANLPSETLLHLEISSLDQLPQVLSESRILKLWQHEEIQQFFESSLTGIEADLTYLLREDEEMCDLILQGPPASLTVSLLSVKDPLEDNPEVSLIATVTAPGRGEKFFAHYKDMALKDGPDSLLVTTVAGRPALLGKDSLGTPEEVAIIQDEDRLVLAMGEGQSKRFFESPTSSLLDNKSYQGVMAGISMDNPLLTVYVNWSFIVDELLDGVFSGLEEEEEAEISSKLLRESPQMQGIEGMGYGLAASGEDLIDRIYVHAPGDRSEWGKTGEVGKKPQEHAALSVAGADLFFSTWFSLEDSLAMGRKENERLEKLRKESGLGPAEPGTVPSTFDLLELIEEKTGIKVEEELVPALGNHVSFSLSVPTMGMVLPELGLILDVADPTAIDELLARLEEKDDEIEELNFTKMKYKDRDLLSARLVHAGLPIMPTACRQGDHLFLTLSPLSMQTLLRSVEGENTLATDERLAGYFEGLPADSNFTGWMDLGSVVEYLYSFMGLMLNAMRMNGTEMTRFDPALLPSGDILGSHLGTGTFIMTQSDTGITYSGKSPVGNPLTGLVGGILTVGGFIGASEALANEVADERRKVSVANLRELARAMQAYKSSVGSGSFPSDLVKLADRGILTDLKRLVDPSDPKPKKIRSGTGSRIKVSYAMGTVSSLPEKQRRNCADGVTQILYSRGAWHDRFGEKCHLILPLAGDEARILYVKADEWGK